MHVRNRLLASVSRLSQSILADPVHIVYRIGREVPIRSACQTIELVIRVVRYCAVVVGPLRPVTNLVVLVAHQSP